MRNGCSRIDFGNYRNQKGAELVELAFIIPLFLALMIGIIEFGRAYNVYENVIHATREGVRAAVADCLTPGNCTPGSALTISDNAIRTKIRGHLQAIGINVPNDSDILIDSATDLVVGEFLLDPSDPGSSKSSRNIDVYNIRVNYTYNFLFLGGIINLIAPASTVGDNGIVLSATVEMRDERSPV